MAYTDLEALKNRLRTAPTPKAKRTYRKRPKISESRQAELMVKLRESADFLEELKLELDALTYQSYKAGLTYEQIADALKTTESALAKRLMRLRAKLSK
jgi:DNA-directed RNA polymerase specialized sigma24 family protein